MGRANLISGSRDETMELANQIGSQLRGGEVIELISDLGGGKTTFTKGLATGLGSIDSAKSPSFTLKNEYKAGDLTIHHLDFYRLSDPGLMRQLLVEAMEDKKSVIVIEWAEIVKDLLPKDRLVIHLKPLDENQRQISIDYPESLNYLINLTS